jgi:hypothetical protein
MLFGAIAGGNSKFQIPNSVYLLSGWAHALEGSRVAPCSFFDFPLNGPPGILPPLPASPLSAWLEASTSTTAHPAQTAAGAAEPTATSAPVWTPFAAMCAAARQVCAV